jgi:hypothetical protein
MTYARLSNGDRDLQSLSSDCVSATGKDIGHIDTSVSLIESPVILCVFSSNYTKRHIYRLFLYNGLLLAIPLYLIV